MNLLHNRPGEALPLAENARRTGAHHGAYRMATAHSGTRRTARSIRDEARLDLIDQRREFQALGQELAHIQRRIVAAYRYNGMSLEKLRRAQNIEDGLPEWHDAALMPDEAVAS